MVDPVEFGKLITAVESLQEDLRKMQKHVEDIHTEVQTLVDLRNRGKGLIAGLLIAGGSAGAVINDIWGKIK